MLLRRRHGRLWSQNILRSDDGDRRRGRGKLAHPLSSVPMRRLPTSLALLSLSVLAFGALAGCDSDGGSSSLNGEMTASVAGAAFTADAVVGARAGSAVGTMLQINGTRSTGGGNVEAIAIMLIGNLQAGTFTLGGTNAVRYGTGNPQTNPQALVEYTSTTGSVTLTELTDDHVEGTFTATVRNSAGATKAITSGAFEADLTSQ